MSARLTKPPFAPVRLSVTSTFNDEDAATPKALTSEDADKKIQVLQ